MKPLPPLSTLHQQKTKTILWQLSIDLQQSERVAWHRLILDAAKAIERARPNPWLTEKEVAARYPLNADWLRQTRCNGGSPPFYRVRGKTAYGSRVVYHAADLDAFLAAGRVATHKFLPGSAGAKRQLESKGENDE